MIWIPQIADYLLAIHLRRQHFSPAVPTQTTVSNIGIILSVESLEHQHVVRKLAREIEKRFKIHTHIFGFVNKKLKEKVTFSFPHFSISDLGWNGVPTHKKLELFLQRHYEVLINFDLHNYHVLHYVSHEAKAKHKLAISPSFPRLYDIVIERGESTDIDTLSEKTLDIFGKISLT